MKACKICKRLSDKNVCPACGNDTTQNFQGIIVIFDVESDVAKKMNITSPGKYAIRV